MKAEKMEKLLMNRISEGINFIELSKQDFEWDADGAIAILIQLKAKIQGSLVPKVQEVAKQKQDLEKIMETVHNLSSPELKQKLLNLIEESEK